MENYKEYVKEVKRCFEAQVGLVPKGHIMFLGTPKIDDYGTLVECDIIVDVKAMYRSVRFRVRDYGRVISKLVAIDDKATWIDLVWSDHNTAYTE